MRESRQSTLAVRRHSGRGCPHRLRQPDHGQDHVHHRLRFRLHRHRAQPPLAGQPGRDGAEIARSCGLSPFVRANDAEYHLIANALDTGADGIIVPRVETRQQAERVVSFAKFPRWASAVAGRARPWTFAPPPWRQALPWLNEQTMVVVQIESVTGMENLEAIAGVAGVDVILVGPLDLSISLGVPGEFDSPIWQAAVDRVLQIRSPTASSAALCWAQQRQPTLGGRKGCASWSAASIQPFSPTAERAPSPRCAPFPERARQPPLR